jgi:hypothetical protein
MTKREFDAKFQARCFVLPLADLGTLREAYAYLLDVAERNRDITPKQAAKWYLPNRLISLRAKLLGRPNPFGRCK